MPSRRPSGFTSPVALPCEGEAANTTQRNEGRRTWGAETSDSESSGRAQDAPIQPEARAGRAGGGGRGEAVLLRASLGNAEPSVLPAAGSCG